MYYLHIPIKTKEDGRKIAEDYFGTMMWRRAGIISIEAYPYDKENPVRIDASQQAVAADKKLEAIPRWRCKSCRRIYREYNNAVKCCR